MADVTVWLAARQVWKLGVDTVNFERKTIYFAQQIIGPNYVVNAKKAMRFMSHNGAEVCARRLGLEWYVVEHIFKGDEPVVI